MALHFCNAGPEPESQDAEIHWDAEFGRPQNREFTVEDGSGAVKSTFIALMTGASEIEIGNGYEPCPHHSCLFRCPAAGPVLQFIDTAGIGEE